MYSNTLKYVKSFVSGLLTLILFVNVAQSQSTVIGTVNFDNSWRFHLGGMLGGEQPQLDDSKWEAIDLPHDWSIEDIPGTHSPFTPNSINQVGGGFTTQGTAWYRKTFLVPLIDTDKQIIIQFDGVYMNADVYINGRHLGNHPYGYTSFFYNITKYLKFGDKNTIAVEVKNEGQNSRWYTGSGIYRHVWLKTLNQVHIAQWGTYITTPDVEKTMAVVNIKYNLINEGSKNANINVITHYRINKGVEVYKTTVESTLKAGEQIEVSSIAKINNPQLWSCDSPRLYQAVTEIYQNKKLIDKEERSFGIRKISFDVNSGFLLNGEPIKLKGGCFHDDNGPLGAKAYDRAEERKVELLKESGFNAIRCSHNPPSPAFLDACDSLGMLVIDEAFDVWNVGKNPYDYHLYFKDWWQTDLESMLMRDRNHPSIIMWSIGNEIPEKASPLGYQTAQKLADYVRAKDPTRPVTAAVDGMAPDKDPFFAALDVCGYNYAVQGDDLETNKYVTDHQRKPLRIMFGTESYPLEAFDTWMTVKDNKYVLGDFVWTAWDYIGEASIGWRGYPQNHDFYPWNLAFCGDIDICGSKRPQSYYRDALWKVNQLSIFVVPPYSSFPKNPNIASWSKWNWNDVVPEWNWNGQQDKPFEVQVYSSCEQVELFLNNRSLGIKSTNRSTRYIADWKVPYHSGELKAIGYDKGKIVNQAVIKTSGKPISLKLYADRTILKANNEDLSYITVSIIDKNGNVNPQAENLLSFSIVGDGKIVGVGNANPMSVESYQAYQRKAWKGKCLVIVKAGKSQGKLVFKVNSTGFRTQQLTILTR
jgi:beta-galactosidase